MSSTLHWIMNTEGRSHASNTYVVAFTVSTSFISVPGGPSVTRPGAVTCSLVSKHRVTGPRHAPQSGKKVDAENASYTKVPNKNTELKGPPNSVLCLSVPYMHRARGSLWLEKGQTGTKVTFPLQWLV